MEQRIDHRNVEMCAPASPFPVEQRMTNRSKRVDTCVGISHAKADEGRRAIRFAGHVHNASCCLGDEIEARAVREWTRLTEP